MFRMTINDLFDIRGRGPVVTGKIESGGVERGQRLSYTGAKVSRKVTVIAIEKFKQFNLSSASASSDDVGLELNGIDANEVTINDVLSGT